MSARLCLTLAAILGFLGVFLGAFGAHGLKDSGFLKTKYADVQPIDYAGEELAAGYKYLLDFDTGVRYHMWHALAMAVTGILMLHHGCRALRAAAWCFFFGIIFFSGSLYVLVMAGPRAGGIPWGAVAPIGGTLLLIGWLSLAVGSRRIDLVNPGKHHAA
jgi:uncharacterized membrane protein YgdD (TMEM256/DUF423 family)